MDKYILYRIDLKVLCLHDWLMLIFHREQPHNDIVIGQLYSAFHSIP